MSNAGRDQNNRPTIIAASNADGLTIVPIFASATDHGLMISDGATGSDSGNNNGSAILDENGVAVLTALSSSNDGTIIEIYGDPLTKALLVKST